MVRIPAGTWGIARVLAGNKIGTASSPLALTRVGSQSKWLASVNIKTPFICQLPKTKPNTGLTFAPYAFPLPNGTSQTKLVARLCRMSQAALE